MLGDTAGEKSKSTLKVAMARRRKKTVTFTAPTYVEASDNDYSSEEEEELEGDPVQSQAAQQQGGQQQAQQAGPEEAVEDDSAKVEPLKPRSQKQVKIEPSQSEETTEVAATNGTEDRPSDEIFDGRSEGRARTTRNGTVRNTDSFFKDETVETKKITLTPNLLRDDDSRDSNSLDSQGLRQRPSFDKLEKELVSDKQKKKEKDKKDKDKKPSGIRSLFSRKDKKKKSNDDDDDSLGKRSLEASAEGQEEDAKSIEVDSPERANGPQRNPSKLQKQQPRVEPSPTRKNSNARDTQAAALEASQAASQAGKSKDISGGSTASLRMVESEPAEISDMSTPKDEKSKISKILHPSEGKPPKVSKAKSRVELDDFDSSDDAEAMATPEPTRAPPALAAPQRQASEEKQMRPTLPGSYPDSYLSAQTPIAQQPPQVAHLQQPFERLSESPVQVSPVTSTNPPALMGDTSSQEDRSSPISSPSPELVDGSNRGHQNQDSMTSTSASATSTWNDNNLRAFFDSSSEIRDLLTVVYDKSDVPPAGPDHPIAGTLFREQNAKLAEITSVSLQTL